MTAGGPHGLVDALCHLDDDRLPDPAAILERAARAGVTDVVTSTMDPRAPVRALAHPAVRVHRAYGMHPWALEESALAAQLEALTERLLGDDVVALGECGLDTVCEVPMALQKRALVEQLRLARVRERPVIFHLVRAHGALIAALDELGGPVRGMVHGYSGSAEAALELCRRGLFVSFGGMVTRPAARRAREAARAVPLSRLLVESDAPDHPPVGFGEQSEPAAIGLVLDALSELRGEDRDALARASAENARRLFGLG